jgi:hypothetical protein
MPNDPGQTVGLKLVKENKAFSMENA